MTGPNTENQVAEKFASSTEPKTLLNSHTIVGEYFNKELLCANDDLNKLKRKLNLIRSKTDGKVENKRSPIRRSAYDGPPLHQVFANIMNKDSCASILADEEKKVDDGQYPKWQVNYIKLEDIIGPYTLDSLIGTSKIARQTTTSDKSVSAAVVSHPTKPSKNEDSTISDTKNFRKNSKPFKDVKTNQATAKKPNKNAKNSNMTKSLNTKTKVDPAKKTQTSKKQILITCTDAVRVGKSK